MCVCSQTCPNTQVHQTQRFSRVRSKSRNAFLFHALGIRQKAALCSREYRSLDTGILPSQMRITRLFASGFGFRTSSGPHFTWLLSVKSLTCLVRCEEAAVGTDVGRVLGKQAAETARDGFHPQEFSHLPRSDHFQKDFLNSCRLKNEQL